MIRSGQSSGGMCDSAVLSATTIRSTWLSHNAWLSACFDRPVTPTACLLLVLLRR